MLSYVWRQFRAVTDFLEFSLKLGPVQSCFLVLHGVPAALVLPRG